MNTAKSVLAVAVLFFLSTAAFRQSSGSAGEVTDPSSGVAANVLVTAANERTSQAREGKAGVDGIFKWSQPCPGDYLVRFAANGFKSADFEPVTGELRCDAGSGPGPGPRIGSRNSNQQPRCTDLARHHAVRCV